LVVIDVQNDFCSPSGLQAAQGQDLAMIDPAIDRLEALIARAHLGGVPVVFVSTTHSSSTDSPEWLARHPDPTRQQSCQEGTWGADFYRLVPVAGDTVVEKHRYSGFIETTLHEVLARLGRRSLLFCGVTTNTCVETSLRDAVCSDYLATLVSDCCGAYSAEAHQRALSAVANGFGAVVDSSHIVAAWALPVNDWT
jgi:ureidoacrylate peracid hydrolase